jgi:hypothetical protein
MTAQLGRPAQLDRAHHPMLHPPEMAGAGPTIGVTVAVKDIRHLQSR